MKLHQLNEAKYDARHYGKPEFTNLTNGEVMKRFYKNVEEDHWRLLPGLKAEGHDEDGYEVNVQEVYGDLNEDGGLWYVYVRESEHQVQPTEFEIVQTRLVYAKK